MREAVAVMTPYSLALSRVCATRSKRPHSTFLSRSSSSWSDDELVALAKDGEARAFEELVRRQSPRIYGLLVRVLEDPTLAEDQAQETFVKAWQGLPRFRGDSKFSTWLIRIALNGATRTKAREGKRAGVPLDDTTHSLPDPGPQPFEAVEARESAAQVEMHLRELPESYRAAVVLRDVEGFSNEEAAKILDLKLRNFKSRLHRGRMALREHLESTRRPNDNPPMGLETASVGSRELTKQKE